MSQPGKIQVEAGWGSEQRGVVEGVPAHHTSIGLDDF